MYLLITYRRGLEGPISPSLFTPRAAEANPWGWDSLSTQCPSCGSDGVPVVPPWCGQEGGWRALCGLDVFRSGDTADSSRFRLVGTGAPRRVSGGPWEPLRRHSGSHPWGGRSHKRRRPCQRPRQAHSERAEHQALITLPGLAVCWSSSYTRSETSRVRSHPRVMATGPDRHGAWRFGADVTSDGK